MNDRESLPEGLAGFPECLRDLVMAEIEAGNAVDEIGTGFPAAPCGAYCKLREMVRSRPRERSATLDFYARNNGQYSGEWTDAKRHFFVLEPPLPEEPMPDMDAIRAAASASGAIPKGPATAPQSRREPGETLSPEPDPIVDRFLASMQWDLEKWRDGVGYDLTLLEGASAVDRARIETLLTGREVRSWRDVEALAALAGPRCEEALTRAVGSLDIDVGLAVLDHAPHLVDDARKTALMLRGLESAEIFGGLTRLLHHIESFHPPLVMEAMWRAVLEREGEVAVHLAAMLLFLHGVAKEPFDWDHRPFFLRFHTEDRALRMECVQELRSRVGLPSLDR